MHYSLTPQEDKGKKTRKKKLRVFDERVCGGLEWCITESQRRDNSWRNVSFENATPLHSQNKWFSNLRDTPPMPKDREKFVR